MISLRNMVLAFMVMAATALPLGAMNSANAATARDLDKDSRQALTTLYKLNPLAKDLSSKAKSILVFPNIVKAGLIFGGSYGEG